MNDYKIYYRYSYKYRLLYCLMINYYRSYYANIKFKSNVLVLGTCKKELMKSYDEIYTTISNFTVYDIITLKKFISFYDNQLKDLFENLENKNISYGRIISDIKKAYVPNKGTYLQCKYSESYKKLPKDKSIVFMELKDSEQVNKKYLIRDIYIPEYFSIDDKNANDAESLCYTLRLYVKEFIKSKDILKENNISETDFMTLSIFLNSDNGLLIEDELRYIIRNNDEDDE